MEEKIKGLNSSLVVAISEAVESMAFAEARVVAEGEQQEFSDKNLMWSQVSVLQPVAGSMSLEFPRGLTEILGEDVYAGVDKGSSDDWMFDVLGEILNTVVGSFMKEIFPDQQFQIGLPEVGTGRSPKADSVVTHVQLSIGEHLLSVRLFGQEFENFAK